MKKIIFLSVGLVTLFTWIAFADQEASNIITVRSSTYGRCYSKSVPEARYGTKGTTKVYLAQKVNDKLLADYSWYSRNIYLQCNLIRGSESGFSIVQIGPWPRGRTPNANTLAIAFYFNKRLLKSYSTLDIYNKTKKMQGSVGHHRVIKRIIGYRWYKSNTHAFDFETFDGKVWSINVATGKKLN